jgi:hypothetical protein
MGCRQRAVLKALRAHDGTWHEGCGWGLDVPSIMRQVLGPLVKRGLVAIEPGTNPMVYRLAAIAEPKRSRGADAPII